MRVSVRIFPSSNSASWVFISSYVFGKFFRVIQLNFVSCVIFATVFSALARFSSVSVATWQKYKFCFLVYSLFRASGCEAFAFLCVSTDENLSKDKKLNTDVWYDEKTFNWVKASFKKKGNWEYRLVIIE